MSDVEGSRLYVTNQQLSVRIACTQTFPLLIMYKYLNVNIDHTATTDARSTRSTQYNLTAIIGIVLSSVSVCLSVTLFIVTLRAAVGV